MTEKKNYDEENEKRVNEIITEYNIPKEEDKYIIEM